MPSMTTSPLTCWPSPSNAFRMGCCIEGGTSGATAALSPGASSRHSPSAAVDSEAATVLFASDGTANLCSLFAGLDEAGFAMCQTVHLEPLAGGTRRRKVSQFLTHATPSRAEKWLHIVAMPPRRSAPCSSRTRSCSSSTGTQLTNSPLRGMS